MIIRELIKKDICFAVVQYHSYLTKGKIMCNQEWELIAAAKDRAKLKAHGFQCNNAAAIPARHRNPDSIISRELDLAEINEFRELKDSEFTKVLDTEDGMIWELKDQSLKQFLK